MFLAGKRDAQELYFPLRFFGFGLYFLHVGRQNRPIIRIGAKAGYQLLVGQVFLSDRPLGP